MTRQEAPGEEEAISVKKCVSVIAQSYSLSMKEQAEAKYLGTPLKRVAQLLAKMVELYPSCAGPLIIQQLVDKLPHKNTSTECQYLYYRLTLDVVRLCPTSEERILEALVDKLCQLDVDIKASKARRRCNGFSSLQKVQQMTDFLRELTLKVPNEKEMKMGLLFDRLIEYIKERI